MKKVLILTISMFTLIGLVGCSVTDSGSKVRPEVDATGDFESARINLPDGRVVTCVIWKFGRAGGMSCDWDNAK